MEKEYRICSHCIMDNRSDDTIVFDSNLFSQSGGGIEITADVSYHKKRGKREKI